MPSASAKLEKQVSVDANDPIKQMATLVEKKVRNLEKRKAKLDSYKLDSQNGKELNEDQKKAIEKYEHVVEVLEFAKEMQKSFNSIVQDTSKVQKKVLKREHIERQQHELQRIKEIMIIQDILNNMGGEGVRNDFLNGTNGAIKLSEDELNSFDELYKIVCPERDMGTPDSAEFEKQLLSAAEHIQSLLDCKNKDVIGTTYKVLKETIVKINSCSYFNKTETTQTVGEKAAEEPEETKENLVDNFLEGENKHQFNYQMKQVEEPPRPVPSTDRTYFPNETPSYPVQSHPIQEVLPVQGNLNFLQESQIDLESPQIEQTPIAPHSVFFPHFVSAAQTTVSQGLVPSHFQQRAKEESHLPSHMAPQSQVLTSSVPVVASVPSSGSLGFSGATMPIPNATTTPSDFDPDQPIPTQTFTNQSLHQKIGSSGPGIAMPQSYVPVTLTHAIPSQHILPPTMVSQPLPQRNLANPPDPAALAMHSQQAGLSLGVSKMSLTNHDAKDHFVNRNFPMSQVLRDSHHLVKPPTTNSQYAHEAYQSTNNNQSYIGHDNFSAESSSYSSNLKRGLPPRGVTRGGGNRGATTNSSHGSRTAYKN